MITLRATTRPYRLGQGPRRRSEGKSNASAWVAIDWPREGSGSVLGDSLGFFAARFQALRL